MQSMHTVALHFPHLRSQSRQNLFPHWQKNVNISSSLQLSQFGMNEELENGIRGEHITTS